MINFIETKIEEVFKVALELGLEKDIFKKALREIAVVAIDEFWLNCANNKLKNKI